MSPKERAVEMYAEVQGMNTMLPELYEYLPRNDFYRLKQLLDEMEVILKRYK